MAIEIERKFLVKPDKLPPLEHGLTIRQAYLPEADGTTVRVRLAGGEASLGIKTRAVNFSRLEFEYSIPLDDALQLLQHVCAAGQIEKQRFFIRQADLTWEIDVFGGENEGLIVAELELSSEDQEFEIPDWIEREVTLDPRFSNSNLCKSPYRSWLSQSPPAQQQPLGDA